VPRDGAMAPGVDADVEVMQETASSPVLDRPRRDAEREELRPADDAVLPKD